ncbi:MAG: expansin EXLX1 family cellulose-binding protein [Candidatus Eisenbacteria bacterium]
MRIGFPTSRRCCGIALLALSLLPVRAMADCAGAITGSGSATFYSYATGAGACSYVGNDFSPNVVAVGPADYAGSQMCGRLLRVTGPLGSVDVRVVDLCPSCGPGELDMNAPAFAAIANPLAGSATVSWTTIPDDDPGTIFLQLINGGNPFFMQILPLYSRYGIASLEYLGPSGFVAARRESYNYFTLDGALGVPLPLASPFTIRLTDVNGQQLVMGTIPLVAGHLHASGQQFPFCSSADAPAPGLPPALALHTPVPNPSRHRAVLGFDTAREGDVLLRLYDASGRRVRTLVRQHFAAGRHQVLWNGTDDAGRAVAPGVYFCRVTAGTEVDQRQVVVAE